MTKQITIRMPQEKLDLWLAALRLEENQSKQARNSLFNEVEGGYCCLGVAQQVISGGVQVYRYLPSSDWLVKEGITFLDQHGAVSCQPFLPTLHTTAAGANDIQGKTFREIADAVEACSEGY